jgi:hypothetical protein
LLKEGTIGLVVEALVVVPFVWLPGTGFGLDYFKVGGVRSFLKFL